MLFEIPPLLEDPLRRAINERYRADETACVDSLLEQVHFSQKAQARIQAQARDLVETVRRQRQSKGGLDDFMYQYNLSSDEGIALMCLAEALLRVPDKHTVDKLIRDKLASADWQANSGKSSSFFVNAATWGLMLTGKLLSGKQKPTKRFASALRSLVERTGEPIVRKAVYEAMKIMGRQFVVGETIKEALERSKKGLKAGYRYSYDMLGEAARTRADAERYFKAYQEAITAIGQTVQSDTSVWAAPGISVKLSALHPRYEPNQAHWVVPLMIQRLRTLAIHAKEAGIGLTVDAEEAYRLDMSLDIIEAVFSDEALKGWEGFGLAVQAYQKRAPAVIDWLVALAKRQRRRLMVRLVKGAYWDTEIKDSQVQGLEGYPVYTRKVSTDLSYLACAQKMANAQEALYPQFATHNAHTVAAVFEMMQGRTDFEFQCLKGMGRTLYDQIVEHSDYTISCRIYAPVGQHEDLLPYLVRRLLENGANTSFVNRIVDEKAPIDEIIADPVAKVRALPEKPHPRIPLPRYLYGKDRLNARGLDLSNRATLLQLDKQLEQSVKNLWGTDYPGSSGERVSVCNPTDSRHPIGQFTEADTVWVDNALARAQAATLGWEQTPIEERASCLERIADLFEAHQPELMAMAIKEAGKVLSDAQAEVREAVDFCRYYAQQARHRLVPQLMPGPTGEHNQLELKGRGVIVCISPWNFPLAIFTGQVVAALAAGNCVLAKPAETTSLIAAKAVDLMYEAGIPKDVLQLILGRGSVVGAQLVGDARISGVVFTGSTQTAAHINQTLAKRTDQFLPLIAETGGQNAMLVDSTALPEQVVIDVITSAFHSAGQRCSALRVLFLQNDIAEKIIQMLKGAMAELRVGDPSVLDTDIGPVIDERAKSGLLDHVEYLDQVGTLVYRVPVDKRLMQQGTFFPPCAYEIPSLAVLKREVFGPILHIIRYKSDALDAVIEAVNGTGYGLTLGIHSRVEETVEYIQSRIKVGNTYINRNMIGAVVGVQPFGGERSSGTGPKAGGPHYLPRLCVERTITVNTTAAGGNASLLSLSEER